MATHEYLDSMHKKNFIDLLRQVVDAYQPAKADEFKKTMNILLAPLTFIVKCSRDSTHDCTYLKDHVF